MTPRTAHAQHDRSTPGPGGRRRIAQAGLAATLTLLLLLVAAGAAFAQQLPGTLVPGPGGFNVLVPGGPEPTGNPDAVAGNPDAVAGPFDDGGQWEVGLEGSAGNLTTATAAERAGMWFWLNGWFVKRFDYAEALAWEEDFKRAAQGGTEQNYLDNVDLMFYVGHGSPGQFTFDNNAHDDGALTTINDCNTSWGDKDNEWLALTSCQVLSGSGLSNMAQCMNKQHLILGFVTNASAHNSMFDTQAYHFSRYMRMGYNMTQSWFKACDVADRGRTVRVIAEETACFNDNPYYSSVCSDVYDSDYYWWTHSCGTPGAGIVPDALQQGAQLPVFKLMEYTEEEADSDFADLSAIFSLPATATVATEGATTLAAGPDQENPPPPTLPEGSPFRVAMADGRVLHLDEESGLYEYTDLNALWSGQAAENVLAAAASGVQPAAVDQRNIRAIADDFLRTNKLLLPDAVFVEVLTDALGGTGRGQLLDEASIGRLETVSSYQVIYARQISGTAVTPAGALPSNFTVVGPGAKLKVYVPVPAPTAGAASPQGLSVVGVQGGWRTIERSVDAASGNAITVQGLPAATVVKLYEALDAKVTMNSIPISISESIVLSTSLAYWESAPGQPQNELIPVYELAVQITEADTGAVSVVQLYVPAATLYLNPIADILPYAPAAAGASAAGAAPDAVSAALVPGTRITLTAADAAQTLAALGYGDEFTFAAGSGGPYTYAWYMGDPIPPNLMASCTTNTCELTVPIRPADKGGQLVVTLVVTDTGSPNQATGTDTITLEVLPTAANIPLVRNP